MHLIFSINSMLILYEFNNFSFLKFLLIRVYQNHISFTINKVRLDKRFSFWNLNHNFQRINLHIKTSIVNLIVFLTYDSIIIFDWIELFCCSNWSLRLIVINYIVCIVPSAHQYETYCLFIFPCKKCESALSKF